MNLYTRNEHYYSLDLLLTPNISARLSPASSGLKIVCFTHHGSAHPTTGTQKKSYTYLWSEELIANSFFSQE